MVQKVKKYIVNAGLMQLIAASMILQAQSSLFGPAVTEKLSQIIERVDCFTDRGLYITGETIRFRADLRCSGILQDEPWSSVLYVELVSAGGGPAAWGKYPVQDHVSRGEMTIPSGILTGNYHLRCYTRWMRNFGPSAFSYVPLKIINPHEPKTAAGRRNTPTEPAAGGSGNTTSPGHLHFRIQAVFNGNRDSIYLSILPTGTGRPLPVKGCLTVVPWQAAPPGSRLNSREPPPSPDGFRVKYLPDLHGLTISGTVKPVDRPGTPVPQNHLQATSLVDKDASTRIHINLRENEPEYLVAGTNEEGNFSVTLPCRKGMMELLVQAEPGNNGPVEISIDPDFERDYPVPGDQVFSFSEEEKETALVMARNLQLKAIYGGRTLPGKTAGGEGSPEGSSTEGRIPEGNSSKGNSQEGSNRKRFFYGEPLFTVRMRDYVLLPTMEEVFLNLVPCVIPVNRKNRILLQMRSENPAISMYDPLMMIHGIPCFDMDLFMSVDPSMIQRIDVINDVYVKGDQKFGGIINLVSNEDELAGTFLQDNAVLIGYPGLYLQNDLPVVKNSGENKIPDTRNTMLWIPEIELNTDSVVFAIQTPLYPGSYMALFRGFSAGNKYISVITSFDVY